MTIEGYYADRVSRWRNWEINPVKMSHPDPIFLQIGYLNAGFVPVDAINLSVRASPFTKGTFRSAAHGDAFHTDAWQYGPERGFPQLTDFVKQLIARFHTPLTPDWNIILDCGTTDGLSKVFHAFINVHDTVLCEEFTYTPVLSSLACLGGRTHSLKMDDGGIDVAALEETLSNWTEAHPGQRFPKMLYTIPSGQNPTGITHSIDRKRKIYEVCRKFDILIVEDDPYGYLVLQDFQNDDEYAALVPKSYLSLDTDGRVLRCESFSKVFAPGMRLGFIVARAEFIHTLMLYSNAVNGPPSGVSQMVLHDTLQSWGWLPGYIPWLASISREYSTRLNAAVAFIEKSPLYPAKISFKKPTNGMFLKIEIHCEPEEVHEVLDRVQANCHTNGVGVILGRDMAPGESTLIAFVRIGISAVNDIECLLEGLKRALHAIETM